MKAWITAAGIVAAGACAWWGVRAHDAARASREETSRLEERRRAEENANRQLGIRLSELERESAAPGRGGRAPTGGQPRGNGSGPDGGGISAGGGGAAKAAAAALDHEAVKRKMVDRLDSDPKLQRAMFANIRSKMETLYSPLMRQLKLDEAKQARLIDFMTERAALEFDIKAAERTVGAAASEAVQRQTYMELQQALQTMLGEEDAAKAAKYMRVAGGREQMIFGLAADLSGTPVPLTGKQAGELAQVLADASILPASSRSIPDRETIDWDLAVARAHGVLSPVQLEYFRRVANQEKSMAKLQALARNWKP